jgi:hypothetical protein
LRGSLTELIRVGIVERKRERVTLVKAEINVLLLSFSVLPFVLAL